MRTELEATFRNVYLVGGIRGQFVTPPPGLSGLEDILPHTFERWGVRAPWGVCDSGGDLRGAREDGLIAWVHVDLEGVQGPTSSDDLPITALLRTTWDALQMFGTVSLSGVNAIAPIFRTGAEMWRRVSETTDTWAQLSAPRDVRVLIEARRAVPNGARIVLDATPFLASFSDVTAIADVQLSEESTTIPSGSEHPFDAAAPLIVSIEAIPPSWTIDHAAWLVEAVCVTLHGAGIREDVQVAVSLIPLSVENDV